MSGSNADPPANICARGRVVLSGPSGSGKNSVINCLLELRPDLTFVRTKTTRGPRDGDIKYDYVSVDEFKRLEAAAAFDEVNFYSGNWYGSDVVEDPAGTFYEIDVNGALQLREKYPDTRWIFLTVPGATVEDQLVEIARRLGADRNNPRNAPGDRLETARLELKQGQAADLIVVNGPDGPEAAAREIAAWI